MAVPFPSSFWLRVLYVSSPLMLPQLCNGLQTKALPFLCVYEFEFITVSTTMN